MSDSSGGGMSDLDDMDDIEMIMQQLQLEQELEQAAGRIRVLSEKDDDDTKRYKPTTPSVFNDMISANRIITHATLAEQHRTMKQMLRAKILKDLYLTECDQRRRKASLHESSDDDDEENCMENVIHHQALLAGHTDDTLIDLAQTWVRNSKNRGSNIVKNGPYDDRDFADTDIPKDD
nr:hypothetical protein [Tanacetum cinerariifolium]